MGTNVKPYRQQSSAFQKLHVRHEATNYYEYANEFSQIANDTNLKRTKKLNNEAYKK